MKITPITFQNNFFSISSYSKINFRGGKNICQRKIIDVGFKNDRIASILSNFTESHFVLDGVKINSMEGFLQSLKTSNHQEQKEICQLIGYDAKKVGNKLKKQDSYNPQILFWQNKAYKRNSKEYQKLLKRAFKAKYFADERFQRALFQTKSAELTHTIGKNSIYETILTEREFIENLKILRDNFWINNIELKLQRFLNKFLRSFK